jgi:hypothetical protein
MKAEIKYLHSPDVSDLQKYMPDLEDDFGFLVQMIIGPQGNEGEESFDIFICTPKWLMSNYRADDIVFGLHFMIVFEFDYQKIQKKLYEFVESTDGKTWEELCLKIGFIGKWEFQDYQ